MNDFVCLLQTTLQSYREYTSGIKDQNLVRKHAEQTISCAASTLNSRLYIRSEMAIPALSLKMLIFQTAYKRINQ